MLYLLLSTIISRVEELKELLSLQQKYLRGATSDPEEAEQGFLTVSHTLNMLEQMHSLQPSVIVKYNDTIVGYALVMKRECREIIPILVPMFEHLDKIFYRHKPLKNYSYYVMGQVCVDKPFRSQGVFDTLYQKHKELFKEEFDFVVTEISTRNHRSLNAHKRVGFKTIDVFKDATDEWEIVLWDWS
ncbi:MAG: GNAT family N-acetyltransferase [Bacteroidetes bacterium]|nr:GNAT family N-acetyltransferase [Bacteroidota bacterium]